MIPWVLCDEAETKPSGRSFVVNCDSGRPARSSGCSTWQRGELPRSRNKVCVTEHIEGGCESRLANSCSRNEPLCWPPSQGPSRSSMIFKLSLSDICTYWKQNLTLCVVSRPGDGDTHHQTYTVAAKHSGESPDELKCNLRNSKIKTPFLSACGNRCSEAKAPRLKFSTNHIQFQNPVQPHQEAVARTVIKCQLYEAYSCI